MDPYWLFLKTVFHTTMSLLTAAAVLLGWSAERDHARADYRLARASFATESTDHARGGSVAALPRDIDAIANRLRAGNPVERARGACEAKKLGDAARPLIAQLTAMLADDAPVPGEVCDDWGRSWSGGHVDPSTPGEKAAAALAGVGTAAYEPLVGALKAPQGHARRNAAWALGAIEDTRAVYALDSALRDSEPVVRRTVAWALGAIEDEQAVPALVAALKDSDAETRAQAAWALGAIESKEATPGLIVALSDPDAQVRSQAAWALGAIEDHRALPELTRVLRQDADAKVRAQAAWALGAIGDERASASLAAALKDGDVKVRRQAAWALGAIQQ